MNGKVTRFYEAISTDKGLREELVVVTDCVDLEGVSEEEARRAMADAVAAFAAVHDLDLTAEDILAADLEAQAEGEVSDAELEAVAGGAQCGCFIIGAVKGGCGCFVVGGEIKGATNENICIAIGLKGQG